MDAGKKITGLVKTGGSVIAGQVAAQLVTDLAIKQVGGKLPDVVIQAASVAGPIALGFGIGLISKNENVQMAGIGCVAAGVGKAVSMLVPAGSDVGKYLPFADSDPGYATYHDVESQLMLDAGRQYDAIGRGGYDAEEVTIISDLSQLA